MSWRGSNHLQHKQHKVNKNIFERGLMLFFKKNFKDKRPYFCLVFSCFNFLLKKRNLSHVCLMFTVDWHLIMEDDHSCQSRNNATVRDQPYRSEDRTSQEGGDDGNHPATYIHIMMMKKKHWIWGQMLFKRVGMIEEAQAHDRRSLSPSPNISSSFSSSPTNRRSGPIKHYWMSPFVNYFWVVFSTT